MSNLSDKLKMFEGSLDARQDKHNEESDSFSEKEQPCWRCAEAQYDDCYKRRVEEELHIFEAQRDHCLDEGQPDYINDEDWCIAIQTDGEEVLEIDLGKEECL